MTPAPAAPKPLPQKRRRNDDPLKRLQWRLRRAWGTLLYIALAVAVLAVLTGWPGVLAGCHR